MFGRWKGARSKRMLGRWKGALSKRMLGRWKGALSKRMLGPWKGALSKAEARAIQLLVKYRPTHALACSWFCSCTRAKACTCQDTLKHGSGYHHVQKSKGVVSFWADNKCLKKGFIVLSMSAFQPTSTVFAKVWEHRTSWPYSIIAVARCLRKEELQE